MYHTRLDYDSTLVLSHGRFVVVALQTVLKHVVVIVFVLRGVNEWKAEALLVLPGYT